MKLKTKIISSLEKVFPDEVKGEKLSAATCFKNEPFSFQLAFKNEDDDKDVIPIYIKVESDLPVECISQYKVGYVPVIKACIKNSDDNFERKNPGLYPDVLFPRKTNSPVEDGGLPWLPRWIEKDENYLINSIDDSYQTLWFTINEQGKSLDSGVYSIKISIFSSKDNERLATEEIELKIIDAELPKQTLTYTSWFHCDCLADTYGVEIFSDKFFEIMCSFVRESSKHGMNMILLPAFTPPLDTSVGKERKTIQLVLVERNKGDYKFDFSLMRKYIELCKECGIQNFEHSHFFTQWGAKHAPKVMATVDGEYKKIFGWETDSTSEEYAEFLKAYLTKLKKFLEEMKLQKNIMFHISDEPGEKSLEFYENAQKIVGEEIKDYMYGDALSHFDYYEKGYTKRPIVIVDSKEMDKFSENCPDHWVYYTGAQLTDSFSNRIIQTTSARNRVIGLQMYVGNAKGFLHWGYNYYYDVLSHGLFNPMIDPCGYNQLAGTSYVVYPDSRGFAVPSLRMKVQYEGFNDYRALQLLETKIGKKETLDFIERTIGKITYNYCPTNKELFEFRQKLNEEIKKYI